GSSGGAARRCDPSRASQPASPRSDGQARVPACGRGRAGDRGPDRGPARRGHGPDVEHGQAAADRRHHRDRRQRVPADLFRQPDRAAAKVRDRARAAVQSVALANFGKLVVYPRAVMLSAHEVAKVVSEVTGRIIERVGARSRQPGGRSLAEVINETLWWEQERLSKADASDEEAQADKQFYSHIRRQLPRVSEAEQARLLERVVHRYADEIAGNFDPTVYKLATRLGPPMLSALLTGLSPRQIGRAHV